MKSLYNEFLTGAEREVAIIIAESDAQIAKLDVLYEAVDATLAANMLAAEAKVFTENGTYDDLEMLYKEASEDANQKKQGVFASIINAIANFFKKIGEFFTSKFGNKVEEAVNELPDEDLQVDKSFFERINIFKKGWDILKGSVEKIKAGNYNGVADIAKAWAPIVTAVGGVAATGTVAVVKRNQILEWLKFLKDTVLNAVNAAIAKLKGALGAAKVVGGGAKAIKDAAQSEDGTEDNGAEGENKGKKGFVEMVAGALESLSEGVKKILKDILSALKTFGGWIGKFLGNLYSALPFGKKKAKEELKALDKVEDVKQIEAPKDDKPSDTPAEDNKTESVSLFGVTLESDSMFFESEMSDEEYSELCELFEEL